jgi:hypothetical protein
VNLGDQWPFDLPIYPYLSLYNVSISEHLSEIRQFATIFQHYIYQKEIRVRSNVINFVDSSLKFIKLFDIFVHFRFFRQQCE